VIPMPQALERRSSFMPWWVGFVSNISHGL
jgi:hypothetical protein